jgi:PEP-CTERM motif-containing protein
MKVVRLGLVIAVLVVAVLEGPLPSEAVTLPACDDNICAFDGDFTVMSLPLANLLVSPTKVQSSPGQIKDGVVLYTGAGGQEVNTNFAGMDNAFSAPSGKNAGTSFSSTTGADPGGTGQFAGDVQSWDSTITAFTTFLNGATPIFFFNQNQENSGAAAPGCPGATNAQDVCVYGSLTLVDLDNPGNNVVLELEAPTRLFSQGPGATDGVATLPAELLLAKGAVCLDAVGNDVACDGNQAVGPVNHNLGANEAAYAAFSDTLNALLATCAQFGQNSAQCPWDSLSIRFDLTGLTNGFEQLFILTSEFVIPPPPVPVPATLLLLGSGLVGVGGGMAWRARRRG